jgi:hypothetical protein
MERPLPRRPLLLALALPLLLPAAIYAQSHHYPLESVQGLRLVNVKAAAVTHNGKPAVRLTGAAPSPAGPSAAPVEKLAIIEGSDFSNGVIEADIAGAPEPGAIQAARGFVGVAFRVQPDGKTYDAFYLRPTNGRAEDQVRRNHSAQYISHPDWTWARFRKEFPEQYESYVDLVPGAWTPIRIEVRGAQARLFVHGAQQPTLIVNGLKSGAAARGAIALWIDTGTEAHFRNLRVSPLEPAAR